MEMNSDKVKVIKINYLPTLRVWKTFIGKEKIYICIQNQHTDNFLQEMKIKKTKVTFETGQTAFHLQDRETITKRSSQWASFLTSLVVHWSLRNVYIRRSHGEQTVARDGQLAEHGVVSTSQQSENNV